MLHTALELGKRVTIEAIASRALGFRYLTHVEMRCSVIKFVETGLLEQSISSNLSAEDWVARLDLRLASKLNFEPCGVVVFDRVGSGNNSVDVRLTELVDLVEGLVKERFRFGSQP